MCVPDYQLTDTRVCNQRPCDLYTWAVTPWSVCLLRADGGGNTSLGCGKPGSGERLRHVQCESAQAGKFQVLVCTAPSHSGLMVVGRGHIPGVCETNDEDSVCTLTTDSEGTTDQWFGEAQIEDYTVSFKKIIS